MVAWAHGSVLEVVDDGVTGYAVYVEDAAVSALNLAVRLNRQNVRRRFEQRFSAAAMARAYVDLYCGLLARERRHGRDCDRSG